MTLLRPAEAGLRRAGRRRRTEDGGPCFTFQTTQGKQMTIALK